MVAVRDAQREVLLANHGEHQHGQIEDALSVGQVAKPVAEMYGAAVRSGAHMRRMLRQNAPQGLHRGRSVLAS